MTAPESKQVSTELQKAISLTVLVALVWATGMLFADSTRAGWSRADITAAAGAIVVPSWLVMLAQRFGFLNSQVAGSLAPAGLRLFLAASLAIYIRSEQTGKPELKMFVWLLACYAAAMLVDVGFHARDRNKAASE